MLNLDLWWDEPAYRDGYQAKPIEVTQFVAAVRTTVARRAEGDRP